MSPGLVAELVTITAINAGSGPVGGGVELPGSALQFVQAAAAIAAKDLSV